MTSPRASCIPAFLSIAASAALGQVTIDFNGLVGVHDLLTAGPYSEDGYTLTSTAAGWRAVVNGFQPNGLALGGTTAVPQVVRLINAAGNPFDLLSIGIGDNSVEDVATFTGSNGAMRLVGHGDLGIGITFGNEWRNLDWVDVTVGSNPLGTPGEIAADNIRVLTVPAPGAATFAALAGVVSTRRRRRD